MAVNHNEAKKLFSILDPKYEWVGLNEYHHVVLFTEKPTIVIDSWRTSRKESLINTDLITTEAWKSGTHWEDSLLYRGDYV